MDLGLHVNRGNAMLKSRPLIEKAESETGLLVETFSRADLGGGVSFFSKSGLLCGAHGAIIFVEEEALGPGAVRVFKSASIKNPSLAEHGAVASITFECDYQEVRLSGIQKTQAAGILAVAGVRGLRVAMEPDAEPDSVEMHEGSGVIGSSNSLGIGTSLGGFGSSDLGVGTSLGSFGSSDLGVGQSLGSFGSSDLGVGQSLGSFGSSDLGVGQSLGGFGSSDLGVGESLGTYGSSDLGVGQSLRTFGSSDLGIGSSSLIGDTGVTGQSLISSESAISGDSGIGLDSGLGAADLRTGESLMSSASLVSGESLVTGETQVGLGPAIGGTSGISSESHINPVSAVGGGAGVEVADSFITRTDTWIEIDPDTLPELPKDEDEDELEEIHDFEEIGHEGLLEAELFEAGEPSAAGLPPADAVPSGMVRVRWKSGDFDVSTQEFIDGIKARRFGKGTRFRSEDMDVFVSLGGHPIYQRFRPSHTPEHRVTKKKLGKLSENKKFKLAVNAGGAFCGAVLGAEDGFGGFIIGSMIGYVVTWICAKMFLPIVDDVLADT